MHASDPGPFGLIRGICISQAAFREAVYPDGIWRSAGRVPVLCGRLLVVLSCFPFSSLSLLYRKEIVFMISSNDLRPGKTIIVDGNPCSVIEFQHVKPGKGAAFVRTKLKNMKGGGTVEKTFRAGEMIAMANLDKREMQYMYEAVGEYNFMDQQTFDQVTLDATQLGDTVKWLKEGMIAQVLYFGDTVIGVDIPNMVELEVVETDPGVRGDTATGGSKPAKMETGAVVAVPFFIETGEKIRIDTRTGEYLGRA